MIRALVVVGSVWLFGACSDDGGSADPCGEPDYAGQATDEVWRVVIDAYDQAEVGSADAVTVTSPTEAQVIAKDGDAPMFTWTSPLAKADYVPPVHLPARSLLALAFDLGVGEAQAHLPPITGDVYYLELVVPGRGCPVRAITTNLQYTLDASAWYEVKAATGPVELTITSVYVQENRISEGPYRPAAPVTFVVQ